MTLTRLAGAAETMSALADPTRLAILELLRNRDQCVCHLVEALDLKQSLISHHLGVLRRSKLVTTYPHPDDRRWMYYRLDRAVLTEIAQQLGWLIDTVDYDQTPMPCPIDLPAPEGK